MEENNDTIKVNNSDLLDIFPTDEDRKGSDILAMSDFFGVFIGKIDEKINKESLWETCDWNFDNLSGAIANAIKGSIDYSNKEVFVADNSHFGQEIIDGLKTGKYHIGRSKEVAGNFRPAVLDKKEHLVKFFTLKKAIDPANLLLDISALSMQASLQKISLQIEAVGREVKSIIESDRRMNLNNKFLYAREKIMQSVYAPREKCEELLKDADTYLSEGLINLYSDFDSQIKTLAKQKWWSSNLDYIDDILSYIDEDMQLIPKYVGLRVYLFNHRGNTDDAKRVLDEYEYKLHIWTNESTDNDSKYTAMELIHQYYPYREENLDYWLKCPKQILSTIKACKEVLDHSERDVYYIDVEESENESRSETATLSEVPQDFVG